MLSLYCHHLYHKVQWWWWSFPFRYRSSMLKIVIFSYIHNICWNIWHYFAVFFQRAYAWYAWNISQTKSLPFQEDIVFFSNKMKYGPGCMPFCQRSCDIRLRPSYFLNPEICTFCQVKPDVYLIIFDFRSKLFSIFRWLSGHSALQ